MGGVAGLLLILALIAFLTRRHRRKVDERRARREREEEMKKIAPSPGATFNDHLSAHHRSRSTANDVYTPNTFGGSYTPYHHQHARQRSIYPNETAVKVEEQSWV